MARTTAAIDTIILYLSEGREYRPELAGDFASAARGYGLFPNRAAYEDLRSAGLQVIRNDSLRQQIVQYYEVTVEAARILEEMRVFSYRTDMVLPQLSKKFLILDSNDPRDASAEPIDYQALTEDVEFLNVLQLWGFEVGLQARWTLRAFQGARSLLEGIGAELAQR